MTVTRHLAQHRRDTSLFNYWVTGEKATYDDALNRLQSAVTTGPEWGLDFAYDGFGNKTYANRHQGNRPGPHARHRPEHRPRHRRGLTTPTATNTRPAEPTTMSSTASNGIRASGNGYAADNRRVYKSGSSGSNVEITFWGIDGRRLVTFRAETGGAASSTLYFVEPSRNLYFAGKLIRSGGDSVILDRLGSVRYRKNGATTERLDYFPYGEEKPGATAPNREKFATYFRDSTGLDYADQRYFNSPHGRFLTPDPYTASGGPEDSASWNRYSYTRGDPVNRMDPFRLFDINETTGCLGRGDCLMAPDGGWVYTGSGGGGVFVWPEFIPGVNGEPPTLGYTVSPAPARESSVAPPTPVDSEPDPEPEPPKPKEVWCDTEVIEAMKVAWSQSANGTSGAEAGFRLDGNPDAYKIVPTPFTNEQHKQSMQVIPGKNVFCLSRSPQQRRSKAFAQRQEHRRQVHD